MRQRGYFRGTMRPHRSPENPSLAAQRLTWRRTRRLVALIVFLLLSAASAMSAGAMAERGQPTAAHADPTTMKTQQPAVGEQQQMASPIPVLAYYYIWFDPSSWDRAKTDYPLLGRYSSDDENVIRQHIRWAKAAGIQGFIVSWKSTPILNARLDKLIAIAQQEDFKLAMIYQGLDFYRKPLAIDKVYSDMGDFVTRHASSPVFAIFDKPLMIWSGIWQFSREDIQKVSVAYRDHLLLLASEKNVKGYQRVADLVDGDAYYWSSINPETNDGYQVKLNDLAQAVHAQHGLWIAPAAPGFDARLVGGTTVVERKNGDTLVQEMNTAAQSSPDAIGIISWNEFSENTYIEPSQQYRDQYLKVLAGIQNVPPPQIPDFDSSEPSSTDPSMGIGRMIAIGGMIVLFIGSLGVILRRLRASPNNDSDSG